MSDRLSKFGASEIAQQVSADKRLSRPTASKPPDARTRQLIDQVTKHGFVIINNAFTPQEVAEAKAEAARLTADPEVAGPAGAKGRNDFEGFKTQRLYALANKSRVFDKFVLHEDVLAMNDHFLDPGYLINTFQSINIMPGETAQTLHYDHGYVTLKRPHIPLGSGVMIALDDYTSTNGATVIVPDSHVWDSSRQPTREEAIPVIMPAGSIIYFLSTLWHGGGANTGNTSRLALTAQYCQPWIRPMENLILAVDWEKLNEMPETLVGMLGYKVGNPFIGFVDGHSPRSAVEGMLKKWKGEGGKAKVESKL